VAGEVSRFLEQRLQAVGKMGIAAPHVALDPGIGFGKTTAHNLQLVAQLASLQRLGRPVCLGVSRKGFIGKTLGRELHDRLVGSLTILCHALSRGAVQIIRVHDVKETRDAVLMWEAIANHSE
jgi:dihydropteroate synthase